LRILALARKYRRHALSPDLLDGVKDAQLVVHQNVVLGREAPLDVVQDLLLVDVDQQHVSVGDSGQPSMFDLAWLKDDIAVRQDHGRAKAAQPLQHARGTRVQPVGERVVHEEGRHGQQLYLARVFDAEALKGADIIAIAQLLHQAFEDRPIAIARGDAIGPLEIILQVLLDRVVVVGPLGTWVDSPSARGLRRGLYAPHSRDGIRDRPTAPRSPWQNGYAERLIGSIRRECLDHVIVFGEQHLRGVLRSYQQYYNGTRTHLSLAKDSPLPRAVQTVGSILPLPILGGLHHHCVRI
jgi:Integrase core domain